MHAMYQILPLQYFQIGVELFVMDFGWEGRFEGFFFLGSQWRCMLYG
jgi:hypothetical protein